MFELDNVKPAPIPPNLMASSNIWATNLKLEKGRRYLVTAPSGKGKSTFLHALYGLRRDYEGFVSFENQNVNDFSLNDWSDIRQEKVSIVFQDLRLFLNLSGWDNLLLKSELTTAKSKSDIEKMAKHLGIEMILNQTCGTMSYGQRQRVAIIRALCQPFDYLLLDEPFSHLDEANIQAACGLIREVCVAQNSGYILVSLGNDYFLEYDEILIL
ncbi:MAG: ABC-type lipoprotein export system ATPase subunit [Saprospiraceae bacterium]|jgi:ABC-type lipoprotein export system ATPase subunit